MKAFLLVFLALFATCFFCHGKEGDLSASERGGMKQELIYIFNELASSGELKQVLENNSTFNIDFPTMGGEVFWDSHSCNGWKLQFNSISGWWRILDENDVRIARGNKLEQLAALLNDCPTSIFGNYMDNGCRFSKTPAAERTGHTVILIHGWGVRAYSMHKLAEAMAQNGYDAYNYDYPTSEFSLKDHCSTFLEKFRELTGTLPASEKIHFLTHSMGGLVLRGAMANMSEAECRRISSIVMLGPPNRGSFLAHLGKLPLVEDVNKSLKDMAPNDESFVSNIPNPPCLPPVGIIAGRFDGKVSLENTRLPEPLSYEHTVVTCTHPGLRKPKNVLTQILLFYSTLSFQK